ncbi:DNA-3-methyladenine glycosylase family protein [Metapseudomonas otitidis]|uniref:DNA-3-methyladenine glycosylase family protein n=1 Tax=Metapseudomonas otitidis TaxID=319939 RepID=UPI0013F659A2|nr:DNA-3-methyladenine glycosylase [Pseudomonas otitidis]
MQTPAPLLRQALPFQPPWHWHQFHAHFSLRRLPGVERVEEHGYTRSIRLGGLHSWFRVTPTPDALLLELPPEAAAAQADIAQRVRRMFDLDCDPLAVAATLARDEVLKPLLERHTGLRLPVAFDPFEQAVRTIIGQQVTVKAAVTIAGRLVERLGTPLPGSPDGLRLFPTPAAIAEDALPGIGMPGKRVETLRRLAAAVASGELELSLADGVEAFQARLCALPGIGPWTAQYIALRAFGDADAFPTADLGLLKSPLWGAGGISPRQLAERAERWRPWRAYAAVYLWHSYATEN